MPKIVDDEGHAVKAILLLVSGMSFIPLNDALIKIMSERLPLAEIVVMRAVISLGILIIFTKGVRSVSMLDRKTLMFFVIRGMCLVAAMYLYFLALSTLPISTVVSIFFPVTTFNHCIICCVSKRKNWSASCYGSTTRTNRSCFDHAPRHKFF